MKSLIDKLKKKWYGGAALWVAVALSQTGFLLGLVLAIAGGFLFLNLDWLDDVPDISE